MFTQLSMTEECSMSPLATFQLGLADTRFCSLYNLFFFLLTRINLWCSEWGLWLMLYVLYEKFPWQMKIEVAEELP